MKSQVNNSILTAEEADTLKMTGVEKMSMISKLATMLKIFAMLLSSNDYDVLKDTNVAKDKGGQ